MTAVVTFLIATLVVALLTPLIRNFALRRGLVDPAHSSRKVHGKPIPRLGGVAIVAGFYAPLIALWLHPTSLGTIFYWDRRRAFGMLGGGLAIALLGVYDDLRGASATKKFIVQFIVAGAMYAVGFRIDVLANPFGHPLSLGLLGLPFTLVWIVGVINAMNLIDGLDGLAGGVALLAVACTFVVALARSHALMLLFTPALAGAILGFLLYNFNPASIFMGDTGSMFLGFVLATSAIWVNLKSTATVAILVPLTALGLPILDTALAMIRRALAGLPLFRADREHIHHRLLARGLTHRQAVLVLYGVCLLFTVTALALAYANSGETAALLAALGGISFLLLRWLGYGRLAADGASGPALRRHNRALRAAIREIGERLREAADLDEVRRFTEEGARLLGAEGVDLSLAPGGERLRALTPAADQAVLFRASFPIHDESRLELAWRDGRTVLARDVEIAIELLCDHVTAALERIEASSRRAAAAAASATAAAARRSR